MWSGIPLAFHLQNFDFMKLKDPKWTSVNLSNNGGYHRY